MAVYAMTIDDQTTQGKALLAYLGTLDIRGRPSAMPIFYRRNARYIGAICRRSSYRRRYIAR